MEDSSEVLSSADNSNLRELIMQKLSAAREQKLKQNQSSSSIAVSPRVSSLPHTVFSNPWEEEKQLLLSMLEKSQNSASLANKRIKELEVYSNKLSDQVKALNKDNKELKSKFEKVFSCSPNGKTEMYLFEEFRKLETLAEEREKQHMEEVNEIREKLLKEYEAKEAKLRGYVVTFEEKVAGLYENIKEKDSEIEKLKKSQKSVNDRSVNSIAAEFRAEKERIERNLDWNIKMSCEKEEQLSDEIVKLKTLNVQIQEARNTQEKELKDQISNLTQEINSLKKRLFESGKKSNEERSLFEKEKHDLKSTLDSLQKDIKRSEAFSTFYTLKSDLQRAQETISQQEAQILQLKEIALSNLDTEPNDKPSDIKSLILNLQKTFNEYLKKSTSSEELHISELAQKNSEISALQSEISDLRHRIVVFESKRFEQELTVVRTDLHKAVAERAYAKRLVVAYIRSVQQLERMINDGIDGDVQNEMFKMETSRLHEENKCLTEVRQRQEMFFDEEMKKMQDFIEEQSERIQELEGKVDSINKNRIRENNEEIKSWIVKNKQLQELNKRLVENFVEMEQRNQNLGFKKNGREPVKVKTKLFKD